MMKDTKSRLAETIRGEFEDGTEEAKAELNRRTAEARQKVDERTDVAKAELGAHLFDLGEQYFPEEARRRRRKVAAGGFVAGVATGVVAKHYLDR